MTLVPPSPELLNFIQQEIKEDPSTRDSYLQIIKEWLRQQPHLPDTWEDIRLLNFLRGCSFSLEKCKKKLDTYFSLKAAAPDLYCNNTLKNLELLKISKMVTLPALPQLTNNGCRVCIIRINDRNNVDCQLEELIKFILVTRDLRLGLEKTGTAGDVYIMDVETVTASHFALITPAIFKKYLVNLVEMCPTKVKEIHVINAHPIINTIYTWIYPFLKKKIIDRIHFHANGIESLYKFVPKEILPDEYGGKAGKLQHLHDLWMQVLEEHEPWYTEQESVKSDESKRPGKLNNDGELFGSEGSFKQLSID